MSKSVIFILFVFLFTACQNKDDAFLFDIPEHFPAVPYPADNMPTPEKIALGKVLFFDQRLSLDSTLSCASCHLPEYAFSDTLALSLGIGGKKGKRNAPTLLNVGYEKVFNKDGGVTKLDIFSLLPIEDHAEMGIPIRKLVHRLSTDLYLQEQANVAFDRKLDPYVITRALSNFVRTLNSTGSKYDDYLNQLVELNSSEERGRQLFFSKRTNCSNCHNGLFFTNQGFENNGIKAEYIDQGRKLVTALESDRGKFKVSSLRNVAVTAPYMHDGSFETLEQVLAHYTSGGSNHANKNDLIMPLELSEEDQRDIIAFLVTLTDKKYLNN